MITFILIVLGVVLTAVAIMALIIWKLADKICKEIMEYNR